MQAVRRVVLVVALLNLSYFGIEFAVAIAIGSVSLFADSVDFLEDALVNLLILIPAVATLVAAAVKILNPVAPNPQALTITAAGALAVNLTCAFLLARHRHHSGSLTKAAWLSARNDAVANIAIIAVGIITVWIVTGWLDIVVGLGIALLNIDAARAVWRAARQEVDAQP